MNDNEKEKYTTIRFCRREYKIIHKNKKNMYNDNLNYFILFLHIFKIIFQDIVYYLDKFNILQYLEIFCIINVILVMPAILTLIICNIIIGSLEYNSAISKCVNDFRNCDIYKKFCFKNIDLNPEVFHDSNIYDLRKSEIHSCIAANTYIGPFIKKELSKGISFIYYFYYYSIPLFTICYYGYILFNFICEKLKKTKENIIREMPIVEEV
jgi:uncharacterized membrane protein